MMENPFRQNHIKGAVATYAYPVKTEAVRNRLDPVLSTLKEDDKSVVIVCPRGGGDVKRTCDYLKEEGVGESRLTLLNRCTNEKGGLNNQAPF